MNPMITLIPVQSSQQVAQTARLAEEIWTEHYATLLPAGQIAYMVEQFQSPAAIQRQISQEAYQYYILCFQKEPSGYLAVQPQKDSLFLSKIYVRRACRRNGLARAAFQKAEEIAREEGASRIWLTVNKENGGSIQAYQALGFQIEGPLVTEIGQGYVMDDYVMAKPVV